MNEKGSCRNIAGFGSGEFMDGRDDRTFKNQEKIIFGDRKTIGGNVRRLRESRRIGQTEMVAKLQLRQVPITRETLVKIEGGRQHIKLAQLRGIRDVLGVSYEDILDN